MATKAYYGEEIYFDGEKNYYLTEQLEEQIRTLLSKNCGVGIIGGNYADGLPICFISDLMLDMLGYASIADFEYRTGNGLLSMISPESRDFFSSDSFYEADGALDLRMYTKTGELIWVRQFKCNVTLEGDTVIWLLSVSDMNEIYKREQLLIRAREEAEQANRAKSSFLARMSHDIRTPMNGILGMARIAREHVNDPDVVLDCVEKINSAGKQLERLINEVLDLSRLESGKTELIPEPFHLGREMEKLYDLLSEQAKDQLIQFVPVRCTLLHNEVIGSLLHLRRILENLLSNAIRYNRVQGTVELSVEEEPIAISRSLYRFTIKDTGIGMSPEFQKHLFEPFIRDAQAERTEIQGSGLGLAITRDLVTLMGGTISVKSEPGQGTTFTIELPLELDPNPPVNKDQPDESVSLNNLRILLVEDNNLNLEIAQYLLINAGARVETARNGKTALKAFLEAPVHHYDVILMDVIMPEMNGLEAAQAIRASGHPQAASIPIIAMTANAFSDDIRKSKEAGMNAHLAKPIDEKRLLHVILHFTRQQEQG